MRSLHYLWYGDFKTLGLLLGHWICGLGLTDAAEIKQGSRVHEMEKTNEMGSL